MTFIKAFAAILTVAGTFILAPRSEAAPLPTNVGAMKAIIDNDVVEARYGGWGYRGGWGGGYRGVGYGYRGYGYRGYGYRGWGAGAVVAGAVVGGAIASSGYYGGYPYYGGGYGSYGGDSYDYCPPQAYGAYGGYGGYGAYGGYYARRSYYSGW